ncbi:hypothetical protein F4801DRAFT_421260 [Xylaria longipes]|nr:hypothetical protein F4801DRAFT_421260 [Xylaria longipes]RYC63355.1 hypothetical protein CHU98_g2849 [Xylaria longipes]
MSWAGPEDHTKPKGCDMCLRQMSVATPCWSAAGCDHIEPCTCGMIYCGHKYCIDCVAQIFELGFKSEAYFPPRCCGSPLNSSIQEEYTSVWAKLAANSGGKWDKKSIEDLYHSKSREYSYRKRVYCAGCENIVHVQNIPGFGICACDGTKKTCITCGRGAEVGDKQCKFCSERQEQLKRALKKEDAMYEELPIFRDPENFKQSLVKQGSLLCFKCHFEIPATKIRGEAKCKCGVKTCIRCLRDVSAYPYHDHAKCAIDDDHKKVLDYAEEIGLDARMCKTCGRILERVGTCRELPCPCGSIFCYNCSHKMASCTCTHELLNTQKQANTNPERGHFCAHINFVRLEPKDEGGPQACAFCFRKFTETTAGEEGSEPQREPVFKCIGNKCGLAACSACALSLYGKMKALVHARHAASAMDMFKDRTPVDDLLFD